MITGLTALLALAGLAIFGVPTLFGMSVVLMFGIVIGTYSSIYVAAPVILLWGVTRGDAPAEPIKPAKSAEPMASCAGSSLRRRLRRTRA